MRRNVRPNRAIVGIGPTIYREQMKFTEFAIRQPVLQGPRSGNTAVRNHTPLFTPPSSRKVLLQHVCLQASVEKAKAGSSPCCRRWRANEHFM
jgi:hypothetical protein